MVTNDVAGVVGVFALLLVRPGTWDAQLQGGILCFCSQFHFGGEGMADLSNSVLEAERNYRKEQGEDRPPITHP